MKDVMKMSEGEVRGMVFTDSGWAIQQILYLRGQLKTAQAAINNLALPRIRDLERELAAATLNLRTS